MTMPLSAGFVPAAGTPGLLQHLAAALLVLLLGSPFRLCSCCRRCTSCWCPPNPPAHPSPRAGFRLRPPPHRRCPAGITAGGGAATRRRMTRTAWPLAKDGRGGGRRRRGTALLSTSPPSPAPPPRNGGGGSSSVCVLVISNGDGDDGTSAGGASSSSQQNPRRQQLHRRRRVLVAAAETVASNLGLPLLPVSPSLSDSGINKKCEQTFTHALTVCPYSAVGGDENEEEREGGYAIGIQALAAAAIEQLGGGASGRRRRRGPATTATTKPFVVDFCAAATAAASDGPRPSASRPRGKRSGSGRGGGGSSDLLVRAVAPRKGSDGDGDGDSGATICDLTAGFGRDAVVLACAGARHVTMVERDPVVACLLDDALRRLRIAASAAASEAGESEEAVESGGGGDDWRREPSSSRSSAAAADLLDRLSLRVGDGVTVARGLVEHAESESDLPDVVYLDPMFPPRTKKAAVKKNMQILHGLLQSQRRGASSTSIGGGIRDEVDDDEPCRLEEERALFDAAYDAARMRVVVKRPINAPWIHPDRPPSHQILGSINRWDVHVK